MSILGDSISDADMDQGIDSEITLKIGFCDIHDELKLEEFMNVYDVVFDAAESDFHDINSLLKLY